MLNEIYFVLFSCFCALIVVGASFIIISKLRYWNILFENIQGSPEWNISNSWVSNLTVFGALISSIISNNFLAATTSHFRKSSYFFLALFFTTLLILAPLIYNAFSSKNDKGVRETISIMYLLSSLLTVWAVSGQIFTLILLLDEVKTNSQLSDAMFFSFVIIMFVSVIIILFYTHRTLSNTLTPLKSAVTRPAREAAEIVTPEIVDKKWFLL